jgi:hypothetical protein
MLIALLNDSTLVPDTTFRTIAGAIDAQLRAHVAPAWGRLPPKVYAASARAWVPGSARLHLVDAIPEAPDALGYHTEDADGTIDGRIGAGVVLDGGTLTSGSQSVSAVLSHEVIELYLDACVNFWAEAPDGYEYPIEGCDAVQGDAYEVGGAAVSVSNFLLPAWFDPMGKGPYDHLGKLARPFQIAPAGYTVRRKRGTGEKELFGARPAWKQSVRGVRRLAA